MPKFEVRTRSCTSGKSSFLQPDSSCTLRKFLRPECVSSGQNTSSFGENVLEVTSIINVILRKFRKVSSCRCRKVRSIFFWSDALSPRCNVFRTIPQKQKTISWRRFNCFSIANRTPAPSIRQSTRSCT